MARDAQEFISFVANHFRPLEAMCRQRERFASDDELVAFLRPFEEEDKNLTRLIGRMREVGVLVELAGEWAPPPFLAEFLEKLAERHALAGPQVIRSWIETLDEHVGKLNGQIESANVDFGEFDVEQGRFLLEEISDVFQTITRTVQDNCERIAAEVADYRKVEDTPRLRSRLNRLIELHDEYLEPIIRIVDINGDFHAVTERVSNCCSRLAVLGDGMPESLSDEARFIRKEAVRLRRIVVRQAEEARRELAPLCEAAARESKIATGVNRALDAIRLGRWNLLDLERNLTVIEEKDGSLFSDLAVERYLRLALETANRPPPRIPSAAPESLEIPIAPDDLIEQLELTESIDDLLAWVLESCEEIDLDAAIRLFHGVLERRPEDVRRTEVRRDYQRDNLQVNAACWNWKGRDDDDRRSLPDDGEPARTARERLPVAQDR